MSFIAGATVMAAEMGASRMVAPHFGSSTPVWAALIAFVLTFLSLGAYFGGRLADRRPRLELLCGALALAALFLSALPFVARLWLGPSARALLKGQLGLAALGLTAFALLAAVPVLLLGATGPFLTRIAARESAELGGLAGALSASSNVGSIFGTLLSALVVIPALGTARSVAGFALALGAAASLGLRPRLRPLALLAPVAALLLSPHALPRHRDAIEAVESPYALVQTLELPDGRRELILDQPYAVQSTYRPGKPLVPEEVFGHYVLTPLMRAQSTPPRVLLLGLGAGTSARGILAAFDESSVVGVELDPEVVAVARRHFDLPSEVEVHVEDARTFLLRDERRFDVIIVDAFRFPYVPFHLVTREFDELLAAALAPGGVVCLNVGRYGDERDVVEAVGGTLASVFPEVVAADARNHSNTLLFAGPKGLGARLEQGRRQLPPLMQGFAAGVAAQLRPVHPAAPLTDDHAPVEQLTDRILVRALLKKGGRL